MNTHKLIKTVLLLLFVVATQSIYAQEMKCNSVSSYLSNFIQKDLPKDFSNDTTIYIYIDNNVVNGLTKVDSIRVDVLLKNINNNSILVSDYGLVWNSNGASYYVIHYPMLLKNNLLFKQVIYQNDCSIMSYITLSPQQKLKTLEKEKEPYCVLSSDGNYINFSFLDDENDSLYQKYNPLIEDNRGSITTVKKKKFHSWITQELGKNKHKIFSFTEDGKVYKIKLFDN